MRLYLPLLALVALVPAPARAHSILYATAASQSRIDGFCLRGDGSMAPAASVRIGTAGPEPRRVKVVSFDLEGTTQALYVAERDRIEVFRIGRNGGLAHIGSTGHVKFMDARDFEVDPVRRKLYVPQRGKDRITAYTLDAEGKPVRASTQGGFTSCLQGPLVSGYLNVRIDTTKDLLYVSSDSIPGRIDIHRIGPDGELVLRDGSPAPPSTCLQEKNADRPPVSTPYSQRKRLQKPKDFIISGEFLYVEERSIHKLTAFRLQPDGTFCDKAINKDTDVDEDCTGFNQLAAPKCARRQAEKQRQQCPASRTKGVLQYEALAFSTETIIGTQFFKGRVDAYRLRPDERVGNARVRLPSVPTGTSRKDVRMTPVRLTTHDGVAYVSAGEFDRVVAYRLTQGGVLSGPEPFSHTDEQKGSFPNDVAVAVLPEACE